MLTHVLNEIAHLVNRIDAASGVAGVRGPPLDTQGKFKLSPVTEMGLKTGCFAADGHLSL